MEPKKKSSGLGSTFLGAAVSAALIGVMCLPSVTGRLALAATGMMAPSGAYELFVGDARKEAKQSVNAPSSEKVKKATKQKRKAGSLTAVPQDISELAEKYKQLLKNDTKAGEISELTYGEEYATHTYNNICVRNTTESFQKLDIRAQLEKGVDLEIDDLAEPTVLLFHSHTSEGYEMIERDWFSEEYADRTTDEGRNVVRVGTAIAEELEAEGIGVVHDKKVHDTSYTGAYGDSRRSVEEYLEKYPSIKVVLDIHRDAIHPSSSKKIAPTAEINGKKAAQIMIITGAQEGKVTDFPDWEYNLRFALALQQEAQTLYPGLMRPVLFSPRKYNMDMTHCNLLLEMGSDVNTLDEAVYAGRLIARSISALLKNYD